MKFNEALLLLNVAVMKEFPRAAFYEAQGYLVPNDSVGVNVDGTIDKDNFKAIYCMYGEGKTIIAKFKKGKNEIKINVIDEPWLEDIVTTPFVGLSAEEAINFLVAACGPDAVGEGPITLRHQLFPGEAEPRYFIGTLANLHTVNVYTAKIDAPAGNSIEDKEPLVSEEEECSMIGILKDIWKKIVG